MSDLFTLHKICEKHAITESQIKTLLRGIESGFLNPNVLNDNGYSIKPKLQNLLDDLTEANLIRKDE